MNTFRKLVSSLENKNRRSKTRYCVTTVLAAVVVFVATYALILPAITLETEVAEDDPAIYLEENLFEEEMQEEPAPEEFQAAEEAWPEQYLPEEEQPEQTVWEEEYPEYVPEQEAAEQEDWQAAEETPDQDWDDAYYEDEEAEPVTEPASETETELTALSEFICVEDGLEVKITLDEETTSLPADTELRIKKIEEEKDRDLYKACLEEAKKPEEREVGLDPEKERELSLFDARTLTFVSGENEEEIWIDEPATVEISFADPVIVEEEEEARVLLYRYPGGEKKTEEPDVKYETGYDQIKGCEFHTDSLLFDALIFAMTAPEEEAQTEPLSGPAIFEAKTKDVFVSVSAPAGAFPAGTTMEVVPVEAEEYADAVDEAVEEGVTVSKMVAVDIIFKNAAGEEIEPARAISVKLRSDLIEEEEEPVILHVDDSGEASVVADAKTQAPDEIVFRAGEFSVYIIAGTTIEKTVLASDGHNYHITATYGPETGIPGDAELEVKELTEGSSAYGMSYEEYVAYTENALGMEEGTAGYIRLFDISIVNKDDHSEKYQPAEGTSVDVRIELEDSESEALSVVHFEDGSEIGDVVENVTQASEEGNVIEFAAESFSVYVVVDGETENARVLVKFIGTDGNEIASMYVKKDDTEDEATYAQVLYDPGYPVEEHKHFMGWATEADAEAGMSIAEVRDAVASVFEAGVEDGGTTLTYYPVMYNAFNLYYEGDGDNVVFKTDSLMGTGTSFTTTVNATYTAGEPGQGLIGWAVKGVDSESADYHIYRNGETITISEDTTLVPVIGNGHWLHFDENDGGTGVGNATYTPPYFIGQGESAAGAEPENPTRPGYTFAGWYTAAEGGEPFNFNSVIENDTTIYAHWTSASTTDYKVIIWAQKVTDDKNAADADKTYDYVNTYTIEDVPVGTVLTDQVLAQYMGYGNSDFGVTDLRETSYASHAFEYRTYEISNGAGTAGNEVNAAGSTVVNVYYDRALFTINFYNRTGTNTYSYTFREGFTGLYGQPLSMYGYTWPTDSTWFSVGYLNSFNGNLFGSSNINYIAGSGSAARLRPSPNYIGTYRTNSSNTTIHLYVEDPDNPGVYKEEGAFGYQIDTGSGFNITTRIEGTIPESYSWSTSSTQPTGTWTNTSGGFTSNRGNNTHLHIRYTRDKNDIIFMYGNETLKTVSDVPFGKSLAGYESETPTTDSLGVIPEGYYFAGWYEDPECVNPVDWSGTMPLANKVIYANIAPEEYHVIIDTDGGTLDPNQKTNFWVPFETVLDDSYFSQATKEGYSLVGWYTDEARTIPWNFTTRLTSDSLAIVYDGPNDPQRAEYGDDGYAATAGVFKLYAKWRDDTIADAGGLQIKYVNPSDAPAWEGYTDPLRYTDMADVAATVGPPVSVWPEGKQFVGWSLNGTIFRPTEVFVADKDLARAEGENLIITLEAVYEDKDEHTPTHIYWYDNKYSGNLEVIKTNSIAGEDKENLHINEAVPIKQPTDFTSVTLDDNGFYHLTNDNSSYKFLGWAKVPDGDGQHKNLTKDDLFLTWHEDGQYYTAIVDGVETRVDEVAADEADPYEDLYAVWERWGYLKIGKHFDVQEFYLDGVEMESLWNTLEFTIKDSNGNYVKLADDPGTEAEGHLIYDGAQAEQATITLSNFVHETSPGNPHEHQYFIYAWVPVDRYIVEENHTQADGLITGYERQNTDYSSEAQVSNSCVYGELDNIGSGEARINNNYRGNNNYAYLKVEKLVAGDAPGALTNNKDFYFVVKNNTLDAYISTTDRTFTTDTSKIQVFKVKPGGAIFYANTGNQVTGNHIQVVSDNEYSIIELDISSEPVEAAESPQIDGYLWKQSVAPGKVTADKNNEKTVKITNTYTAKYGSLKLEKLLDESGDVPDGASEHEYRFTVTNAEGKYVADADGTLSDTEVILKVKPGEANAVTINNLEPGAYTVTELTESIETYQQRVSIKVGENSSAESNTATAEVIKKQTTEVEVTNRYQRIITDIYLNKVDKDNQTVLLPNAEFKLYRKNALGTYASDESINATKAENILILTDGILKVEGLPSGDYMLTELNPPAGYVILVKDIYFTVNAAAGTDESIITVTDGQTAYTDVSVGANTNQTEHKDDTFVVPNEPGAALPSTGGPGTRLFTLLGSMMICLAGALLWRRRRTI